MDIHEVLEVTAFLHELYQERFPVLTPQMARIWYEDLRRYSAEDAEAAVRQWARQHTLKVPSLDELCEAIEFLVEERRRQRRPSPQDKSVAQILEDQIVEREEHPACHKLMLLLMRHSCEGWTDAEGVWHDKLTLEQRAIQCYEWAQAQQVSDPDLAERLRYQARAYAQMYHQQQEAP